MSSDLHLLDCSVFRHSPETIPSGLEVQFPFDLPLEEPSLDFLKSISDYANPQPSGINPSPSVNSSNTFPANSPPSNQMHGLSLEQTTLSQSPSNQFTESPNRFANLGSTNASLVKLEQLPSGFVSISSPFPSYMCAFDKAGLLQRSFSSHSIDHKPSFLMQPHSYSPPESSRFRTQMTYSDENSRFTWSMRRASSSGDLHMMNIMQSSLGSPSPLASENSSIEDPGFKVGRYNAEERRQRIHRYRSKRNQRNFHKTIKYACRKTLADSRPRVRGRFARNDETGEIPRTSNSNREEEEEEDLWSCGFPDEEEEMAARGLFANNNSPHFQYLGF